MSAVAENLFINITVDPEVAADPEITKKMVDACPVDIFAARDDGTCEIVTANLDECVLCYLCFDVAPAGSIDLIKLYEQ